MSKAKSVGVNQKMQRMRRKAHIMPANCRFVLMTFKSALSVSDVQT